MQDKIHIIRQKHCILYVEIKNLKKCIIALILPPTGYCKVKVWLQSESERRTNRKPSPEASDYRTSYVSVSQLNSVFSDGSRDFCTHQHSKPDLFRLSESNAFLLNHSQRYFEEILQRHLTLIPTR